MLKINCSACRAELVSSGGLLFGPPDEEDQTTKQHLCTRCYMVLNDLIGGYTITGGMLVNSHGKPQLVILRRQLAGEALERCPVGWKRQPVTVQL